MSRAHAPAAPLPAGPGTRTIDLAIAVLVAAAVVAFHAVTGFPGLEDNGGDNDSLLRLVQIRALMDGQGWFDLQQYRMGLEGGFPLHWSRLVDLPIALLIMAAGGVGLPAAGAEAFALTAWPALLYAAALFLIVDTVRRLGSEAAILPAIVLGAAALYFTGEFEPGAIDHHNIQLVLVLAMLNRLAAGDGEVANGLAAGAFAALSIAIGMETAPYVAVAGAAAAILFLVYGSRRAPLAQGFGFAFFVMTGLAFLGLVHPGAWSRASCDALSVFQLAVAATGGLGLAAIAAIPALRERPAGRVAGLAAIGLLTIGVVALAFPQCLGSPYADLDPRMRELWLDHVTEAQPLFTLLSAKPFIVLSYYVTPLLGLAVALLILLRDRRPAGLTVVAAMIAVAFLVSAWQVRGSTFAIPLAVIALAVGLGQLRAWAAVRGGGLASLALVGGWLAATNAAWALAGGLAGTAFSAQPPAADETVSSCYARADHAALAALSAGTVLAVSNLGAAILANTDHRVFAGPYHRNQAGNLFALAAQMAPAETARGLLGAHGVDYVAICPGNTETAFLADRSPDGLLAGLAAGRVPDWLAPLSGAADESALLVFAVK
ncbi:GtrA family protein [Chelativorans sp. ZYF759]|uniref:GtrA family protein n=1 Tax=Chelativorans sp. ZYF759 TaxID=2692213 RepID=UPI00145C7BC3|nr:GtrA family protein [Chelativorans sp. ZYF759]NMG37941.1 GtrA family protein [Chelativorans sp. ZYF759]